MTNFIFVVPARSGSKGVPGKNFKKLKDKALIDYTLDLLKNLTSINFHVIVSTDNLEYKTKVKDYGYLFHYRSIELSNDDSMISDVIYNAISQFKDVVLNFSLDNWVILLEPTSPLRSLKVVNDLVLKIINNDCLSYVSVVENSSPRWTLEQGEYQRERISSSLRQKRNIIYQEVGVFYASEWNNFLQNGLISRFSKTILVPKLEAFDINDLEDWDIVYKLI